MEEHDKDWQELSKRLFEKVPVEPSEAFVQGVMRRIEADEAARAAGPRVIRIPLRIPVQWFAPVMGAAAVFLLALLPGRDFLSAETLVVGGELDAPSSWALRGGSPQADEMLSFVMEAK